MTWNATIVTVDGEELEKETPDRYEYPHRDPEVLYRLHHEEGLTVPRMSQRLNVAYSTVLKQMQNHGIERRNDNPGNHTTGARWKNTSGVRDPAKGGPMPKRHCPECGEIHLDEAAEQTCMREAARRRADHLEAQS